MDINKAKELVSALAEGVNPLTGEVLPQGHVCNQVEIVRAFYTLLCATKPEKERAVLENAGKPWSSEADEELKTRYLSGEKISSLSKYFQRTRGSIESRLAKLGLIDTARLFK